MTDALKPGQMVVAPAFGVGMIESLSPQKAVVKFGADGPRRRFLRSKLRHATTREIEAADLASVGREPSFADTGPLYSGRGRPRKERT